MWATLASHLLAPLTAAVPTNGSGTPVSANLVSEQRDDAGVVDRVEYAVTNMFTFSHELTHKIITLSCVQQFNRLLVMKIS